MKSLLTLFFCCLTLNLFSSAPIPKKQTVCLNMIVKNETPVIRRCLDSAMPLINYWVIVDTGSTDGTQDMIKTHLSKVPGELHERPWVNFAHNRNEALALAKGKADYILFIDADEVFKYDSGFSFPALDKDFYHIMTHFGGTVYARVQLIKEALNWKWAGVLHEVVDAPEARTHAVLSGIINEVHTDGARSQDPDKYIKDAKILEAALQEDPNNSRNVFYLAQSYKDAGDYENGLKHYRKRAEMGGWDEEVYWSLLQSAILMDTLNKDPQLVVKAYLTAYHYRPSRMEALYYLTHHYRLKENYPAGYLMGSVAAKLPMTGDSLFVQKWMHDYGLPLELSICAYWIGKYEECVQLSMAMLADKNLPANVRECVEKNLIHANRQLIGIALSQKQAG